jgi:hypothetical protein
MYAYLHVDMHTCTYIWLSFRYPLFLFCTSFGAYIWTVSIQSNTPKKKRKEEKKHLSGLKLSKYMLRNLCKTKSLFCTSFGAYIWTVSIQKGVFFLLFFSFLVCYSITFLDWNCPNICSETCAKQKEWVSKG